MKALGLVLGWVLLYDYLIEPDGRVDGFLTEVSTSVSSFFLYLLGFNTEYRDMATGQVLYLDDVRLLGIAHSCNGLILYAIFVGFILIFPSSYKSKFYFSLLGTAIIFLMNIGRIVSLCLIYLYHPSFFQVSHKFIFTILLYGVIFILWMFWVNRLLPKKKIT